MVLMKQKQIQILKMVQSEQYAMEKVMVVDVYLFFERYVLYDLKLMIKLTMKPMEQILNDYVNQYTNIVNAFFENDRVLVDYLPLVVDMMVVLMLVIHTMGMIVSFDDI